LGMTQTSTKQTKLFMMHYRTVANIGNKHNNLKKEYSPLKNRIK
jgi:hypothetical protein